MENKNNVFIIGLLALIAGLLIGSFADGSRTSDSCSSMMDSGMMSGGMMHGGTSGDDMMRSSMEGMMDGLEGKTGAAFEEAFLTNMIVHHQGAIAMAQELRGQTQRPELIKLADDIVTAQTNEITMMQQWLAAWF